ncbi:MAG TPA: urease accessory protein UreE [Burkholderiales bacterium]|nr:urease accessory protein UreE [Burkholderiales bacterium]
MLLITARCESRPSWDGELVLPFELRQKSRLRTTLASGEEVGLFLERGDLLRGGDFLRGEDGRVIRVVARDEQVLDIFCDGTEALARVAYHLGNRHVPLQVGDGWLRIAADHVLRQMVEGLGAKVVVRDAPFEPEAGAYAGGHSHEAPPTHGGIIHEFGRGAGGR